MYFLDELEMENETAFSEIMSVYNQLENICGTFNLTNSLMPQFFGIDFNGEIEAIEKIIQQEEPRIQIISIFKETSSIVLCFLHNGVTYEFRRNF
jgi:hypothetical protein